MAIETVRVEMLGTAFTIQTDESREYVQSVLAYLRDKVDVVKAASRVDDPLKASILAGVYLVDELFRERVEGSVRTGLAAGAKDELGIIAERLIARIDDTLNPPGDPGTTKNGDRP